MNLTTSLLVLGAPGTGKTTYVENLGRKVIHVTQKDLTSTSSHNPIEFIYSKTLKENKEEHIILLYDDIDTIFYNDESTTVQSNKTHSYQFVNLLKKVNQDINSRICIIGATSREDKIDANVRKSFSKEIVLGHPAKQERIAVLKNLIQDFNHKYGISFPREKIIESISDQMNTTPIAKIVGGLRKVITDKIISIDDIENYGYLTITEEDLFNITDVNRRLKMQMEHNIGWSSVIGLDDVKKEIIKSMVWPIHYESTFKRLSIDPCKGLILHGPPGTGKTLLAKAIASQFNFYFVSVSIPDLIKSEVGESEKAIASYFKTARENAPSVLFIDEFQALFGTKDTSSHHGKNMLSQLLSEMDGIHTSRDVIVFATTNELGWIDPSFLRPGRFDKTLYVGPPDSKARREMIKTHFNSFPLSEDIMNETFLNELTVLTESYTGAEIKNIFEGAAFNAMKRNVIFEDGQFNVAENTSLILEDDLIDSIQSFNQRYTIIS